MTSAKVTEGKIPFIVEGETFETHYKLFGDITQPLHVPTIAIHGGPGITHDVLVPLGDLASNSPSTAIILYDQLGSGLSTHLKSKDVSFWTIDLFIDELENILSFFKIDRYNIIGHSWGATLAAEFVIRRQPKGLKRLVLQNCLASAKLRNKAMAELRAALPEDVQATLKKNEEAGTTKTAEYRAAMMVFWERHACRIHPFPPEVAHSMSEPERDPTVLDAMRNGPTGLATEWDITDNIHMMKHIPLLLINGEYDFMTDEVCAPFYWGIDKVKWVKFANSSHMPHWEERERYMKVVRSFLSHD
ncbi:proline-specific peptidase [Collybia nuda]|uniref:Proline-specific peptidase n=1 Tax=Collybia nuda TaxID=64659 RepID=A0A9P5Y8D9_9AGAR|nr:proline-specific peptidase [Collybia nuda]